MRQLEALELSEAQGNIAQQKSCKITACSFYHILFRQDKLTNYFEFVAYLIKSCVLLFSALYSGDQSCTLLEVFLMGQPGAKVREMLSNLAVAEDENSSVWKKIMSAMVTITAQLLYPYSLIVICNTCLTHCVYSSDQVVKKIITAGKVTFTCNIYSL